MKRSILILLVLGLLLLPAPAAAAEAAGPQPIPIYTPEDLANIAQDPSGSYILMNDLDMSGIDWTSLDFTGTLDGGGFAILNLTVTHPSGRQPAAIDGNVIEYIPRYYGLFGTMENAAVRNLTLLNVRACIVEEEPCFLGALAGYSADSTVTDCTVVSSLELRAHQGMFGIGGVIGFGTGSLERCVVDAALICVDTDDASLDEQFLGGAYASGFIDVTDCSIHILGYISEYGYVHSGGIAGMSKQYPLGMDRSGIIARNHVSGSITFFECCPSRRAYCDPFCGERLTYAQLLRDNTHEFVIDERWDYSAELRPELCETPVYTEKLIPGGCDSYGCTEYTCQTCGYAFRDNYTLPRHTVTEWTVTEPATLDAEGRSTGSCDLCGAREERTDPTLPPPETTAVPETVPETVPAGEPEGTSGQGLHPALWFAAGMAAASAVFAVFLLLSRRRRPSGGRYLGKK